MLNTQAQQTAPETSPSAIPHTYQRNGVFYFVRRVPRALAEHHRSPRILFSLRTRNPRIAADRAARVARQLDEHWFNLKLKSDPELGGRLMPPSGLSSGQHDGASREDNGGDITMTAAAATYLKMKGNSRPKTFHQAVNRNTGYFVSVCGDKPITVYERCDVTRFRDWLVKRGMTGSSVARVLNSVKAIVNFAANETGVPKNGAFTGVYVDKKAGVKTREPVPDAQLDRIKAQCRELDDERRWLVGLLTDTGMRLAEAAGIRREDIVLKGPVPYVYLVPHTGRTLKTEGSRRKVPLVGVSLWAAERILAHSSPSPFAFPSYNKGGATNANSASAALNKWLKSVTKTDHTIHCLRHSMRDRLRAVE